MHFSLLVWGSDVAFVDDESSSAIALDRTIFSFQAFIWKVDQVFIELWLILNNIAFSISGCPFVLVFGISVLRLRLYSCWFRRAPSYSTFA